MLLNLTLALDSKRIEPMIFPILSNLSIYGFSREWNRIPIPGNENFVPENFPTFVIENRFSLKKTSPALIQAAYIALFCKYEKIQNHARQLTHMQ